MVVVEDVEKAMPAPAKRMAKAVEKMPPVSGKVMEESEVVHISFWRCGVG